MHPTKILARLFICAALIASGEKSILAQTTATWIGPTSGGEWNTGANWDTGAAPADATTNAFIGTGNNVSYNLPMTATSFGILTNYGILNVNAGGFNCGAIYANLPGGVIDAVNMTNSSSVVTVNNAFFLGTNGQATLGIGASLTAFSLNVAAGETSHTAGTSTFTNLGGTINVNSTTICASGNTGTGRLTIFGGTNNLGNTTVGRYASASASTLGTEGLAIFGGVVTMTNLTASAASYGTAYIAGGTVTNYGNVNINGGTAGRYLRVVQSGGLFVVPDPGIIYENATTAGAETARYQVTGGTNIVGGIYLGATNNTVAATVTVTVSAPVYVGSQGIVTNGAVISTFTLNSGGKLGATADWTNLATITLNGGTLDAENLDGTPHNIFSFGSLNGGALTKTGGGSLTLAGTNTCSSVSLNAGTLLMTTNAAGAAAALPNATIITVAGGTTFDVSSLTNVGSGFLLGSAKTIAGAGLVAGAFTAGPSSTISPAGANAEGTLNFANGLSASDANFSLELTDDSSGVSKTNDLVNIVGDLTVSGTNNIIVTPVGSLGFGTYKLIKYTGNLNGGITNFACVAGVLTNLPGEIDLIVSSVRPTAILKWRGDGSANVWDTGVSSNWFNGVALDRFFTGDTNIFDDSSTNFVVNLSGILSPAPSSAVLVNATNDYTFAGSGDISGTTGLTKTNSGKLTILTANDYTGITTFSGGTLSVSNLQNGGVSSPIGAATSSSGNLLFNGGTLEYLGTSVTENRGATFQSTGTLSISNTTLTISGLLTGPGMLIKAGNGQLSLPSGNDYGGGTMINAGSIRASQGSGVTISVFGTNALTLGGTSSNAAFVFGGDQETLVNTLNLTGTQNFTTNSGNDTLSGITGSGTVFFEGSSGNVLTLQAPDMTGLSGTLVVDTVGNLRFLPSSGTSINAANATIDLQDNSALLNNKNGNFTAQIGALAGGPSTKLQGASSADSPSTYIIGGKNIDSTFSGTISEVSSARIVNLVKVGTGTFTLKGDIIPIVTSDGFNNYTNGFAYTNLITYTGSTTISNGVLALVAAANLNTSHAITIASSSAVLDVSQMGYPDETGTNLINIGVFEVVSGQAFTGLGTIRGGLLTDSGSTLNVGLPGVTGILTATNSVTLGGNTYMKLSRANAVKNDQLVSTSSTITYGGTLVVTNIGSTLHSGDVFTLFSGNGLSAGSFSSIVLPNYYNWDTTQLGVNGTISVSSVQPLPAFTNVNFSTLSSGSITFNAVNGIPNGPVSILTTTNLALPLSSWSVAAAGNFDGSGNYSVVVSVNPAAPQSYFTLKAQ